MKADHMAFEVADMDKAIRFYSDVLGLPLLSRQVDEEHGEEFAFVGLEGCNIELLRHIGSEKGHVRTTSPTFSPHFAIGVSSLEEPIARLAKHGIKPVKGPLEIAGLVRWVYFADPDENIIEFVQWIRSS
ncbi:MAG TPA: VOC family protein [Candidatus Hydrogenedentes bacterium]|nr:VOC family protein [Candidatus Hydrogenedentota bacterium]HOL76776.1 VOC family protein [Candidatus Hydrogenedentota bacterium]HPO85747.1 VOC family protein [Candidatus Hydrogenedentota bacterium]